MNDLGLNINKSITVGPYNLEEYCRMIQDFHGNFAPGIFLGGFMIDLALKNLPEGEFFDVLCETGNCLPDAVQLLTPCTIGNGWLKIIDVGRFAVTFFEKYSGRGVRVYMDPEKLESYREIKNWFYHRKPKKEQSLELLVKEMKEAGTDIFSAEPVTVREDLLEKKKFGEVKICPECGEAYPEEHGGTCRACDGILLYSKN